MSRGYHPIYLDYPVQASPRYGWGSPPHQRLQYLIGADRESYRTILGELESFAAGLRAIPTSRPRDASVPYWMNGFVQGLDSATLYAFPKLYGSKRYFEIGSGNSTKFVRRSIEDHSLNTRIVSIDPSPRAEVDSLCDEVIREPLEHVSLDIFDRLEENDVLMIDSSHRCFQNSDVTVVFLEVLPRLQPGVLVYIDDIYLPHDYPAGWQGRYYSEQYLLGVLLLADSQQRYEILFPGYFAFVDSELKDHADRFWQRVGLPDMQRIPSNGFWLRVRGAGNRTSATS